MTVDGIPIPDGLKVEFSHVRPVDTYGMVLPHGGTTVARLKDAKNERIRALACAACSEEDSYVKAVGRKIALRRALRQLDLKGRRQDNNEGGR